MKLVLHIGTEKTGTTLLQDWLYANKTALSAQGVFLSAVMGQTNNRKIVSYFQTSFDDFTRRNKIHSQAEKAAYFEGFEAEVRAEIKAGAAEHHTMVITSEHFHSRLCDRKEIQALAAFLKEQFSEVKVLCYFREQASMRESLYSTGLKVSEGRPLELFHADAGSQSYYYNFLQIATRWSEAFGQENMDFRIYDRARFCEQDIRKDFLAALPEAVDQATLSFDRSSANESLSLLQGRMLQVINRNIPFWNTKAGVNPANGFFKGLVARCKGLSHGQIRDRDSLAFSKRFAASNREFLERFMPGEKGFADVVQPSVVQSGALKDESLPLEVVADVVEEITDVFTTAVGIRILLNEDAVVLRDLALKYDSGAALERHEALALMRLAQRVRPWGPVITEKIREWESSDS